MEMLEFAKSNLAGGADAGDDRQIAIATAQAVFAIAESLHGVQELLSELIEKVDHSAAMVVENL